MSLEKVVDWLRQCARYGSGTIGSIIITGGEPFYAPSLLTTILETNDSLGLISVVITNGFWARSVKAAEEMLERYPQIDVLSLSTDRYHRRFIPIEKIRNAAVAAKKKNIPFNIAICIESREDLLESLAGLDEEVDLDQLRITSVLPVGRGRFLADSTFTISEDHKTNGPCLGADFPIIFPDGRVMSCMGMIPCGSHPLQPGNLNTSSLAEILQNGERENFLHIMRCFGQQYLLDELRQTSTKRIDLGQYIKFGSCALCYAMADDPDLLNIVLERVSCRDLIKKTADERVRRLGEIPDDEIYHDFSSPKGAEQWTNKQPQHPILKT